MTEILFLFVIVFLGNGQIILGLNTVTDYDDSVHESRMILWKFRRWAVSTFGEFWSKPICTCPPCMSSLHSTYIYFPALALLGAPAWVYFCWPLYALALAGQMKLMTHAS